MGQEIPVHPERKWEDKEWEIKKRWANAQSDRVIELWGEDTHEDMFLHFVCLLVFSSTSSLSNVSVHSFQHSEWAFGTWHTERLVPNDLTRSHMPCLHPLQATHPAERWMTHSAVWPSCRLLYEWKKMNSAKWNTPPSSLWRQRKWGLEEALGGHPIKI